MAEIMNGENIKVIAFYLPQYHPIPENDIAWGKGFTEWVNVKKAIPMFAGHYQPKIPLNNNYYSLLDDHTAKWQSDIAQKYGIFGFCYYHYWFKDGKKLLEQPAEKMLKDRNITIPFCFCWANENWSKTWDGGNNEIIVKQEYGSKESWEEHFKYLLEFFKDSRYITLDGKPIFIIYKPGEIPCLKEFIEFIKKRCVEEGMKGCEIIFQHPSSLCGDSVKQNCDYYIAFEPLYSWREREKEEKITMERIYNFFKKRVMNLTRKRTDCGIQLLDYDDEWKRIIQRDLSDKRMIAGAFVDWDNSARKKNGQVYVNGSPEKFENYMSQMNKKIQGSKLLNVLFLTAWNEWGEGSYLEPDERYGFDYLTAVKNAIQ